MANQKVISVVVHSNASGPFAEHEFPKLNEYLGQGYFIKEVHQIAFAAGGALAGHGTPALITFLLSKREP